MTAPDPRSAREAELPSSAAFYRRMFALSIGISLGTVLLTSSYLLALLRLTAAEWQIFGAVVAVSFVGLATAVNAVHRRLFAPVLRCLDARPEPDPETCRAGFAGACALPARTVVLGLGWWALGGVLVAAGTGWLAPGVRLFECTVMVAAATSAGSVTTLFNGFLVKRMCRPIRAWLATRLDPAERERLVRRVPLRHKLRVSIAGVTLVMVLFTVFLAQVRAVRPVEEQLARVQTAFLEEVVAAGASGTALAEHASRARRLGIADALELLPLDPGAIAATALAPDELVFVRSRGRGDSRRIDSPHVFAFVPAGRSHALVALLSWGTLRGEHDGSRSVFAILLALSALVAWALGSVLAGDIVQTTGALHAQADRVAGGDLRGPWTVESEDELGELSRAFERMVEALRGTVVRVGEAAERLEGTAVGLEGVGLSVELATGDQAEGVVGARDGVEALEGQMGGIAGSAQALSASVEESGSSVLELSASGEQLSETARGLEARVSEVSVSIGQTLRSVREVGSRAEALHEAAEETSGSMEEMAGSLKEVDRNAEQMGRLAERVVEAAEGGAERVRRAREGMEAIREATGEAEAGMRGLSARAEAIGAIVDVIDSVADETNLLALNAAIIAAQAGEQGRAFSVVAEEIKELADRVLSGSAEIGGLIRSMQAESAAAVAAVERGSRSVREGMGLSEQAGEALEAIRSAARESGARTGEIVAAVREQSRAASHVVELMERVREGAEQIRGAGREQERGHEVVAAGALAMREVAGQVHRTTAEQARGAGRIRDSLEQVREAVGTIHRALEEQRTGATRAAHELRRVASRTDAHRESMRQMADATRDLRAQAKSLRDDVKRFRT